MSNRAEKELKKAAALSLAVLSENRISNGCENREGCQPDATTLLAASEKEEGLSLGIAAKVPEVARRRSRATAATTTTTTTTTTRMPNSEENQDLASTTNKLGWEGYPMGNCNQQEEEEQSNNLMSDIGDQVVRDAVLKRLAMHGSGGSGSSCSSSMNPAKEPDHTQEDPQPMPRTSSSRIAFAAKKSKVSRPGAYSGSPGTDLARRPTARFSLVGVELEENDHDNTTKAQQRKMEESATSPVASPVAPIIDENSDIESTEYALSRATLIPDESLKRAMPVDFSGRSSEERRKNHLRLFISLSVLLVCLALLTAAILGGFLAARGNEASKDQSSDCTPSIAPSQAPSVAPPQGDLDILMLNLPQSTLQNLNNIATPQWRAQDWLLRHPELSVMPEWRKAQLFALATFYFAMEGPNWREDIRRRWLQYSDECYWFSTGFGKFNFATGKWIAENRFNMTPCNQHDEFQLLDLVGLELAPDSEPYIPQQISLLTSLQILSIPENRINASLVNFLPYQIYYMTNLTRLDLARNDLLGPIPTELGLMTSLSELGLFSNSLTGQIPTELGLITRVIDFMLHSNMLTGSIPTQLGLLKSMTNLELWSNSLTSSIPVELGLATSLTELSLDYNSLTGEIPLELALLPNLNQIWLSSNDFTGTIPIELGSMPKIQNMWFDGNSFTGSVPQELESLVLHGFLESLQLHDNPLLDGAIPEALCSLGLSSFTEWDGLSFDCSEQLCGCCWCPCEGGNNNNISSTNCNWTVPDVYDPTVEDEDWPGSFPTPINTPNMVTINIHTDEYPEENTWEWSTMIEPGNWEPLDLGNLQGEHTLYSYTKEVGSDTLYRLRLSDSIGDGMCCDYGSGWFSITNSTPSVDHAAGTVIWNATGEALEDSLDVFIWVDATGNARLQKDTIAL